MTVAVLLQAVAGALYLLMLTLVGIRLLLLARRTRELPELVLGLSLLLGGTLGSSLEASGMSAVREYGPELAGRLLLTGKLFGMAGFLCQGVFIWRVFRPLEWWPLPLLGVLLLTALASLVGFAYNGSFADGELDPFWFWVEFAGRVAAPCWLLVEAGRYYGLMRRRQQLGLADPVLVNRFLLWAFIGGSSVVLLCTSVPPLLLDRASNETILIVDMLIFSSSGMLLSLLNWLAFFPPAAYRRRLEARAAGAAA